jgi:thiosulfate/3-mercaptopyruvate sulfurtransferase
MESRPPLLLEPAALEAHLDDPRLLVVDLSRAEQYTQGHVPGAVHVEYAHLVAVRGPAHGALPDEKQLSALFSALGLTHETHVVAYDDECNGRAARLLWTLDVIGHPHFSLLNGGLEAWTERGGALTVVPGKRRPSRYTVDLSAAARALADKAYVLARLGDRHTVLLDTRSPGEYHGRIRRAARAGHIPGAVNFDWVRAMDPQRCLRIRPAEELKRELESLGVTPDKEVIVYCQTHHRSAHTYIVLKALGYPDVKGYPGSWSEWGNLPDTPIE